MIRNSWIALNEQSTWKDALEGVPHAFGHTWENCYAMSLSTGYDTYLYTYESNGVRIVCPIAERSFHGHIDILTPYGFSGFTGNGSCLDFPKHWKPSTHRNVVPFTTYAPWVDDIEFNEIYTIVKDYTMVDIYRLYELWSFVKRNNKLSGDILEVGVWRGGSGCILAKSAQLFSDCRVYLADTFSGVVKASEHDPIYKGGEHSDTGVEIVEKLINKLDLKNVELLNGIFPNEINLREIKRLKLKLCHIDVDTYKSAKDIFYYIWPHMVKGGAVIFDDYGFYGCEGVTKLCNGIDEKDATFIYNLNGHAIFIKV